MALRLCEAWAESKVPGPKCKVQSCSVKAARLRSRGTLANPDLSSCHIAGGAAGTWFIGGIGSLGALGVHGVLVSFVLALPARPALGLRVSPWIREACVPGCPGAGRFRGSRGGDASLAVHAPAAAFRSPVAGLQVPAQRIVGGARLDFLDPFNGVCRSTSLALSIRTS